MEVLISDYGVPTRVGHRDKGGIYIQQGKSWVMLSSAEIDRLRAFMDQPAYESITPAKWMHQ
ncbi:hypothetical protein BKG62_01855 [Mycobacteroides chelonae]|uniref:Uncharacterized protein n=1 Tax=Mycobacteroides chelonae TaxID=1774 RepID=A0AB73LH53_MYCCH|nr:hypothetical protein [Mycobacteroides chelonae]OHT54961.1 hypothetical protein BKG62_01855 [Mycobacteroides chelonae]OHU67088.1 hypothetical protein BKG87_20330 [Mycobacteroides chelonae]